jgi:uncharacterized protein with gpF-like domain
MHNDVSAAIIEVYALHTQPAVEGVAHDAPSKNPSVLLRRALVKWGGLWTRKLDRLSLDLSRKFARKNFTVTQTAMKAAFKEAGFTVAFSPTKASVTAYHAVAAEQVNLIKSIPAQYLKDVQSNVWTSVMKGGDLHQLSKTLQKNYDVTAKRAALIARDQNNKATGTIEKVRQQELGITDAFWQHSHGGKVPRPTHLEADGRRYKIAQGLWDPDAQGKGKGQFVQPGELINCRCTNRPILPFL